MIAGTSFEVPSAPGTKYWDLDLPTVDHALANHVGEPEVNFVASGGEIGYTSYYWNTRDDLGLTDGDWVGPTIYVGDVTAYPDGVAGFQISDADGKMTTTMDTLSLAGLADPTISLQWFVNDGGWEIEDFVRIWVTVEPGGVEIDILNTAGTDIDDLAIVGVWTYDEVDLTGYTSATLAFEVDCNSASETLYVDDIQLTGTLTADVIFSDGFEDETTDAWSAVLP